MLSTYNISAISNSNTEIQINPDGITMRDDDNTILSRAGIILPNGDYDHVLTSNGLIFAIASSRVMSFPSLFLHYFDFPVVNTKNLLNT